VPAGPAGAPTRGMAHILPTGRNFYAVDPRALPSQAAWRVGQHLAREAVERFLKEEGSYPEMMGLASGEPRRCALMGMTLPRRLLCLVLSHAGTRNRGGFEGIAILPLEKLGRPRVDVTLRISGFFRDAFPHLIDLFDQAVSLVIEQDEPLDQNFPRKHYLADLEKHQDLPADEAEAQARYRMFGAKPGAYGAGILPLIESGNWKGDQDFARAFLEWGGYAYGQMPQAWMRGQSLPSDCGPIQVALHNQDNREHDIFDSDDYFQFHGGMVASIRALTGTQPKAISATAPVPMQYRFAT